MVANVVFEEGGIEEISASSRQRYRETAREIGVAKMRLRVLMERHKVVGFPEVVSAPLGLAVSAIVQTLGMGKLRPNTIVLCWPSLRHDPEADRVRGGRMLRLLGMATAFEKAVVALKRGTLEFPKSHEVLRGTIDIWWVVHVCLSLSLSISPIDRAIGRRSVAAALAPPAATLRLEEL
jgi:hypothetical protein